MTSRLGASGSRWLKSLILALCVDAAGMGLAGILLESTPASVMGNAPAGVRVRLGPALSEFRAAAPRPQAPEAAPPASTPAPAPVRVQEAGPASPAVQPPKPWAAEPIPDADAGPGADVPQSYVSAGGTTGGTTGETTGTELLRRIDALVRENLTYPPLARKRNIEGVVRLSLLIGKDGRLTEALLVGSSGSSILDKAAMTLVEGIFPLGLTQELYDDVAIGIRVAYSLTS